MGSDTTCFRSKNTSFRTRWARRCVRSGGRAVFFLSRRFGSVSTLRVSTRAHFHVDPPGSFVLGVRSPKELIVSADRVTGLRMCFGSRARRRRARESLLVYPHIFYHSPLRSTDESAGVSVASPETRTTLTSHRTLTNVSRVTTHRDTPLSSRVRSLLQKRSRRARRVKSSRRLPARFSSTSAARR